MLLAATSIKQIGAKCQKDVRSSKRSFEVDTKLRLDLASQNTEMVCNSFSCHELNKSGGSTYVDCPFIMQPIATAMGLGRDGENVFLFYLNYCYIFFQVSGLPELGEIQVIRWQYGDILGETTASTNSTRKKKQKKNELPSSTKMKPSTLLTGTQLMSSLGLRRIGRWIDSHVVVVVRKATTSFPTSLTKMKRLLQGCSSVAATMQQSNKYATTGGDKVAN